MITAKIAGFTNSMLQSLIGNLQNNKNCKKILDEDSIDKESASSKKAE